jgi:hypothetical protein
LKLLMWDIPHFRTRVATATAIRRFWIHGFSVSRKTPRLQGSEQIGVHPFSTRFLPRASKGIQGTGGGELCPPWFNTDATRTGWWPFPIDWIVS